MIESLGRSFISATRENRVVMSLPPKYPVLLWVLGCPPLTVPGKG